jgi:hypothetical protein
MRGSGRPTSALPLCVNSGIRDNHTRGAVADYDDILTNFAPIAKRRPEQLVHFANQKEEIDLFDARTQDSADMSHYGGLLRKALASIEHTFQKRAAANLLSSRSAVLPSSAEAPTKDGADFDLVTWMVILSPDNNG